MITRSMSLASLVLALAACGQPPAATSVATTPTAPAPAPPAGLLSPDGTRFATETIYQGECAPAGSRGGCHTLTLRPDGTFRNFLFDAALDGTYTIAGAAVTLVPSDPAMTETLTLSADGTKLGELTLQR